MLFKQWVDGDGYYHHEIRVDETDAWEAFTTMRIVIHGVMKEYLRQRNTGGCAIDIEDIPEHIHYDLDGHNANWAGTGKVFCADAFYWIVEEILWATNPERSDSSFCTAEDDEARERNAMRLFGKYFFGFWN